MISKKTLIQVLGVIVLVNVVIAGSAAGQTGHPAFYLYDESDRIINPVSGVNDSAPYSPRQTCEKCHDYDLITQGFHFQQGFDERDEDYGRSHGKPWMFSPGMIGKW